MSLASYISSHKKSHIIFDFDATLVLINVDWLDLAKAMREDILELDEELWKEHENTARVSPLLTGLQEKHGDKGRAMVLKHVTRFELQYKDSYTKNHKLLSEVAAFRDKYRMFIWSSNSRELLEDVLRQLDMSDWFDVIVGRGDVGHIKPSPEGFELIRDPKVPLERYVLVGDSSHDEAAAKAAGIDFYKHDFFEKGR